MKRFLLGISTLLLGVSLGGCGGDEGAKIETPAVDPNDTATVGTGPPKKGGGALHGELVQPEIQ